MALASLLCGASVVEAFCGDGIPEVEEQCDDGNAIETDGCTTECRVGVACGPLQFPGGDAFAVHPQTGHCYVSFDSEQTDFEGARTACRTLEGDLATISGATEDAVVTSVQNPTETPWIGAVDDAITTDTIFDWVDGSPFFYSRFAAGQPDDDAAFGGGGDCLHLANSVGEWEDTNCQFVGFVTGRICEIPEPRLVPGLVAGLACLLIYERGRRTSALGRRRKAASGLIA